MGQTKHAPPVIRSTAEFARHVGLSRSAVSRVINGRPGLRAATVERVRRAIEATGFTPNAHAVHLRGKPTALIGVCVETLLTPTGVAKLAAFQERLQAHGYTALIEVPRPGASRRVVEHFRSLRVEAIVFIGHFDPPELQARIDELGRHGLPHLVVDHSGCARALTVTLDRHEAMERIVAHLHWHGHRRFGLLGVSGAFQTIDDRLAGLRAALARRGLDAAKCVQSLDAAHERTNHFEYGHALARAFAARPARPTAFIAVNDDTAIGALLGFQAAGLRVPRDLSIVGFNNQHTCLMTQPPLTSLDQAIERTVEVAVAAVLSLVRRRALPRARVRLVEPVLVVRGSTGPAPGR